MRLPQTVQAVLDGYTGRPALGQRAVNYAVDPASGRTVAQLLPRFDTITYRELADRVRAAGAALAADAVRPGDRVAILGFTSIDYTVVDMALGMIGAVSVPLQTSASVTDLRPIVKETEPSVIAASVDALPDAVELAVTAHAPARLVVFDHHAAVDDHRDAVDAARTRLAGTGVVVESLADVLDRGRRLPAVGDGAPAGDNPLTLLIYTSGSTGAPRARSTPSATSPGCGSATAGSGPPLRTPVDLPRRPRARAAHRTELRAPDLGDALSALPK